MKRKNNMRIAIVRTIGHVLDLNNYNCQELGLAKAMTKKGISVDIYLAGSGVNIVNKTINIESKIINVYEIPYWKFPGWQCYMPDLIKQISSKSYDVIQINEHNYLMSFLILQYAVKYGIPLVLCQGMYEYSSKSFPRFLQKIYDKLLAKQFVSKISATVAKTNYVSQYLSKLGFKEINICPIGLDDQNLSRKIKKQWTRDDLGISESADVLLYVGILEERRDPYFLIEAFSQANILNKDIYLLIVGSSRDDNYQYEFEKYIHNHAKSSRIKYIPNVSQWDIGSIYQLADVFLMNSSYEIYGMVYLEAMYYGLPIITTLTAGSDLLVENEVTGFICARDTSIWVDKINKLLNDKKLYSMMSTTAKERVLKNYIWDKAVDNFIDVYMGIVKD